MVILVLMCIITTLFTSSWMLYGIFDPKPSHYVMSNFFIILDTFINCVCFMLQFSVNNNYYKKICKYCHIPCRNYFIHINSSNKDKVTSMKLTLSASSASADPKQNSADA